MERWGIRNYFSYRQTAESEKYGNHLLQFGVVLMDFRGIGRLQSGDARVHNITEWLYFHFLTSVNWKGTVNLFPVFLFLRTEDWELVVAAASWGCMESDTTGSNCFSSSRLWMCKLFNKVKDQLIHNLKNCAETYLVLDETKATQEMEQLNISGCIYDFHIHKTCSICSIKMGLWVDLISYIHWIISPVWKN